MNREPVVTVMSILAGLQVLTAGAALSDVIGAQVTALLVLLVAAVQTGVQFYVRGQVTPLADAELDGEAGHVDTVGLLLVVLLVLVILLAVGVL